MLLIHRAGIARRRFVCTEPSVFVEMSPASTTSFRSSDNSHPIEVTSSIFESARPTSHPVLTTASTHTTTTGLHVEGVLLFFVFRIFFGFNSVVSLKGIEAL